MMLKKLTFLTFACVVAAGAYDSAQAEPPHKIADGQLTNAMVLLYEKQDSRLPEEFWQHFGGESHKRIMLEMKESLLQNRDTGLIPSILRVKNSICDVHARVILQHIEETLSGLARTFEDQIIKPITWEDFRSLFPTELIDGVTYLQDLPYAGGQESLEHVIIVFYTFIELCVLAGLDYSTYTQAEAFCTQVDAYARAYDEYALKQKILQGPPQMPQRDNHQPHRHLVAEDDNVRTKLQF